MRRTSAQKISSLYTRNEKEILQSSDGAQSARNFTPIARSRKHALEAIVRDLDFLRHRVFFSREDRARSNFSSRSKKYFRSRVISAEINDDI